MEEMPVYNSRIPSHSTIITVAGMKKKAIMMCLLNVNVSCFCSRYRTDAVEVTWRW